ncbi:cyclase (adenylyl or guanylyl) [Candidatus Thiomargarita nelsonii]|uniref:Cyclase (Adenylyl or guanylyl) n=1 Tax=Candidatus Thiomargarita nelsonii TaxID=1003181 RepID=A0A176RSU4_9GAMM|nr:cyclase (adenylyl or guanylyl) [Candidatus Thiomargarita nelsonii]
MAEKLVIYLQIDKSASLIDWGGAPQDYGLTELKIGKPVIEQVSFLEGMLTAPHIQVLPFVCVGKKACVEIHIVPVDNDIYVLMFDVTHEHEQQQKMQQQGNDLSILTYRQSQLLERLNSAIFQRKK